MSDPEVTMPPAPPPLAGAAPAPVAAAASVAAPVAAPAAGGKSLDPPTRRHNHPRHRCCLHVG